VTTLQALGLGALQGLTEFLPVSSSGHLVLARELLNVHEAPVTFEVLLHAASLVAILLFFRREVVSVFTTRRQLILPLIVGTIPAGLAGVLLKSRLEAMFASPVAVGVALLFTGTVLVVGERLAGGERRLGDVDWRDGLWIGIAQAIALVPGVSRSGMTVSGGLASRLERRAAVAFAFLLGAVAISGAAVLEAREIVKAGERPAVAQPSEKVAGEQPPAAAPGLGGAMVAGFAAALVVSLAALALLVRVVQRKRLAWFGIYCYVVGGAVLLAKLTGLW